MHQSLNNTMNKGQEMDNKDIYSTVVRKTEKESNLPRKDI